MEIDFDLLSNGELKQLLADAKKEMDFREAEEKRIHLQATLEMLVAADKKGELTFYCEATGQEFYIENMEKKDNDYIIIRLVE
jgi:hypothetical protein